MAAHIQVTRMLYDVSQETIHGTKQCNNVFDFIPIVKKSMYFPLNI